MLRRGRVGRIRAGSGSDYRRSSAAALELAGQVLNALVARNDHVAARSADALRHGRLDQWDCDRTEWHDPYALPGQRPVKNTAPARKKVRHDSYTQEGAARQETPLLRRVRLRIVRGRSQLARLPDRRRAARGGDLLPTL